MMKHIYIAWGLILIFKTVPVLALSPLSGQSGFFYVQPAWSLSKSTVAVTGFSHTFLKNEIIRLPNQPRHAVSFRTMQNGFRLAYGLNKHLELGISQLIYQDHHQGAKGYNIPDDLWLSLKLSMTRISKSYFRFGALMNTRLPIADKHNVILEPYSSNRPALAVYGMLSYAPDFLIPETVINLHLNLGYCYHSDVGEIIVNNAGQVATVLKPTQELQYGIGWMIPSSPVDFLFELSGNAFIRKPPHTAYARENYCYFTPSLLVPICHHLKLTFGIDFRLTHHQTVDYVETRAEENQPVPFKLPIYPHWRLNIGLNFNFQFEKNEALADIYTLPLFADTTQLDTTKIQLTPEENELKKIAPASYRELQKIKTAKESLEKLKDDRKRRDQALEELRKKINDRLKKIKTESKDSSDKPAQPEESPPKSSAEEEAREPE